MKPSQDHQPGATQPELREPAETGSIVIFQGRITYKDVGYIPGAQWNAPTVPSLISSKSFKQRLEGST